MGCDDKRADDVERDRLRKELERARDEYLEVRLTSRLMVTLGNSIRGAMQSFVKEHGASLANGLIESASKRVRQSVWAILRDHPDVRRRVGEYEDELRASLVSAENECRNKADIVDHERAERDRLTQTLREMVDRWRLQAWAVETTGSTESVISRQMWAKAARKSAYELEAAIQQQRSHGVQIHQPTQGRNEWDAI